MPMIESNVNRITHFTDKSQISPKKFNHQQSPSRTAQNNRSVFFWLLIAVKCQVRFLLPIHVTRFRFMMSNMSNSKLPSLTTYHILFCILAISIRLESRETDIKRFIALSLRANVKNMSSSARYLGAP